MKRFLIAAAVLLCAAATGSAQDIPLSKILVEGEEWTVAAKELPGVKVLAGQPDGTVLLYQKRGPTTYLKPDGTVDKRRPQEDGNQRTTVPVMTGDILAGVMTTPAKKGQRPNAYYIMDDSKEVLLQSEELNSRNVPIPQKLKGVTSPCSLVLWPDESHLVIGESDGAWLWAFRIDTKVEGLLGTGDRYYSLRTKPGEKASNVTGMVMDTGNLLYAATPLGVQVFDPTGRLCGVILPPAKEEMTAITIGGEKGDTLFVAAGDKVYSRKIQGKAVYTLKKEK
jgi:sugar lactone lactonase YvrE